MSGQLWVPGAIRLDPSSPGGNPDYPAAGPRAVAHTTESPAGSYKGQGSYWFHKMHQVLRSKAAEPTLLYDPSNDTLGQYFPLNETGRALRNDGGRRTNRVGAVCIQIEFLGFASRPFTRSWEPGPNFTSMMRAIGSWGIPERWPSGRPPAYPDGHDGREAGIWYQRAGWYGHSQVPGNYHGDPGQIAVRKFFGAADEDVFEPGVTGSVVYPGWRTFPGKAHLGAGKGSNSFNNLLIKSALIVHDGPEGYTGTTMPKWDKKTAERLDDFKRARGIDEDGVGERTWNELGRVAADAPDFPGDKAFEYGKSTPNSLRGQALLVLQGHARALGNQITREWRPEAKRALRRFQLTEPRLKGDPDGEWGPLTWKLAWTDNT